MMNFRLDLIAFLASIVCSILLGLIIIPLLKRLKAGQNVLSYVDNHAGKAGTTTMGGFIFGLSAPLCFLIFSHGRNTLSIVAIIVSACFLIVGFLDDIIKIKSGNNQGLTAKQKIIFQTAISILTALFVYNKGFTHFFVPFLNKIVDLGFWGCLIVFFVFISTTNCVNLTDGLDGLAGGVSYVYLLLFYILIELQIRFYSNNFVNTAEAENLALFCLIQSGALIGFLLYNTFSAKVFMGDTGSLYLGGVIATTSIFSSNVLFLPLIGIMYVVSGISVIVQVCVFKLTNGKRVFLMAPLHHHFEYKGHSESKIVFTYKLITLLVGVACIISIM